MKFHVIAVSRRMPAWVNEGVGQYVKRMGAACPLVVREVSQVRRTRNVPVRVCLEKEGRAVLEVVPRGSYVVALDRHGRQWTTLELASEHAQMGERRSRRCVSGRRQRRLVQRVQGGRR